MGSSVEIRLERSLQGLETAAHCPYRHEQEDHRADARHHGSQRVQEQVAEIDAEDGKDGRDHGKNATDQADYRVDPFRDANICSGLFSAPFYLKNFSKIDYIPFLLYNLSFMLITSM